MLGIFKNYIEKRINLVKLETSENIVKVSSLLIYGCLLLIIGACMFTFFLLGIGIILGNWLGSYAYGFLLISVILLLCFLIFLLNKKALIQFFKEIVIKLTFEK